MKNTSSFIHHLSLLLLIAYSQTATASLGISPSLKYINSGKITVDTSTSYNLAASQTWNPLNFYVTYPNGIQQQNPYTILMSLVDFKMYPSSNRMQFYQNISKTSTSFTASLYSQFANFIQRMSYRYVIISTAYVASGNMYMVSLTYTYNANLPTTASTAVLTFSPSFNMTGTVNSVCFITGMDINATSSSTVSMIITATVTSSTTASFYLKSTSTSTPTTYVYYLKFDFLAYNDGYFNRANYANFYYSSVQSASGTFPMVHTSNNDYTTVTAVGLNGISVQGDAFIDITLTLTNTNSITFSSANTANTVKSFSAQYIIMMTYYCGTTTPYFYATTNLCYDICPSRTYTDPSTLTCTACPYDCFTCNSTNCLTCNQATDYRVFNSSTSRCVPMTGYYQNQTTVCPKCSTNCLDCLNLTNCVSCISGTYLSNGACNVCPNGCSTCILASQCQTCNTGYTLSSNYMCYNTCPSSQYFNTSTFTCNSCPNGCTSCVSSTSCSNCPNGTYLSSGVCNTCPNLCKTCLSSTYCYTCNTGSFMRSDQLCYSSCLDRTYGDSSQICVSCPYDCLTCNASGSCISCSSSDKRVLNNSTFRCVPTTGYYDNQTTVCLACPSSCSSCLSATICTSCVVGYYLSNRNCLACPSSCQSCLSSTFCQGCKTGYYLNFNTNLCATTCPSGYYADTSTLVCNWCSSNCLTCSSSSTNCNSCSSGLYLSGQTCVNCPSACSTCTSSTTCQTCVAGYYKNSTGSCVAQCSQGQYLSISTSSCTACLSTCMTCTNNTACTSCYPGYYLNSNNCYSCPKGQYLNPNLTCQSICPIRYYADTKFNTCQPCPYDCYTCDNTTKCTSCHSTTDFRVLNSQTSRCIAIAGYYDNSTTICVKCSTNCAICTSSTSCTQCNQYYYLNNGACQVCPSNCASCSSSTYCYNCKTNYYLRPDNLCYSSCLVRTYLYQNMVCVSCPYSCLTCNSYGYCLSCSDTDYRVLKDTNCVPIDGYYDNHVSTCVKCPDGCATCQSYNTCTSCKQQYYLNSNNASCLPCAANCKICFNANSCDTCNSQFSLNSGTCKVSQGVQSSSSSMPIGIMAGIAIGCLAAITGFCIYRKCKGDPKPIVVYKAQDGFASSQQQLKLADIQNESQQNKWHSRQIEVSARQDCSICLFQQTFFRTSCGHHFHVSCIIEWLRKRNNCPNCRELLTEQKHKIYCRRCHAKYKVLKLDKLNEMAMAKREDGETICDDCKMVPI